MSGLAYFAALPTRGELNLDVIGEGVSNICEYCSSTFLPGESPAIRRSDCDFSNFLCFEMCLVSSFKALILILGILL